MSWFRRKQIEDRKPFCPSCASKDNEIVYLRQHVDELLDRLMGAVGLFQAQKDAISEPVNLPEGPHGNETPPESEAEAIQREEDAQDRVFVVAQKEVEKFAEGMGVEARDLADV